MAERPLVVDGDVSGALDALRAEHGVVLGVQQVGVYDDLESALKAKDSDLAEESSCRKCSAMQRVERESRKYSAASRTSQIAPSKQFCLPDGAACIINNGMDEIEENAEIPAIVVGHGYTGLGTLRSLVMAGIPAYVACPANGLVSRSRWYRPVPGNPGWDGSLGPHAFDVLRALPIEKAVLIAGSDEAALWLTGLAENGLGERFLTSSSARSTLEILGDKTRFGEFLAETEVAHPRTFTIHDRSDIDSLPFDQLDRVFIKPSDSHRFSEKYDVKGIWAKNRAEFEAAWATFDADGYSVVAQEYIPGSSAEHYFIDGFRDRHGDLCGLFARRRIRIYPRDFGNSCYCISVPLSDLNGALAGVGELLSRLSYRGIFSAEFKRDSRDGVFRILEVNARAWWYVEFPARCGVNIPAMAYRDARNQPAQASSQYVAGAGCVNLVNDIQTYLSQRHGNEQPTPLFTFIRQWSTAHYHVFKWNDPKPGLTTFWHLTRRWTKKLLAHLPFMRITPDPWRND